MKTNIKLAFLSALTVMIVTQPAHGMQGLKEQFKTSRVAQYASVVTFVGLITGNKKLAGAGACVVPLALITPQQYKYLMAKAVENYKTLTGVIAVAGVGYELWKLYSTVTAPQQNVPVGSHVQDVQNPVEPENLLHTVFTEQMPTAVSNNNDTTINTDLPSREELQNFFIQKNPNASKENYDLANTFLEDIFNGDNELLDQSYAEIINRSAQSDTNERVEIPLDPQLENMLDDALNEITEPSATQSTSPLPSPRVERVPTTPLGSPRIIPKTNIVIVDAPKESHEQRIAKLAMQLNIFVKTNDVESCIKFNDMLKKNPDIAPDALRYDNKMLFKTASENQITKKTVLDAYKQRKISLSK